MSFGFSAGDFLAIIQLVNKVRKDFAGAPEQFKDISNEVRSLAIVIQDIDTFVTCQDISESQEKDLSDIIDRCRDVLQDTQRRLGKYSTFESTSGSIRERARRAWKQLAWEPDEIRDLRNRITSNTGLLIAWSHSFTRDKVIGLVEGQNQLKKGQEQQYHREVLDWLTPTDYATQQSDFISRRQKGTGQWFLESQEYQNWVTTKSEALFCPGIPGAGKTMLASIVVEHLCDTFHIGESVGICYIYCNYQRTDEQKLNDLMASLLKQLTYGQSSPHSITRHLYDQHRARRTRPSVDKLRETLHSVAMEYSRVFVVVDALDECQTLDGCRSEFICELLSLQTTASANIFATSRFIPEITEKFENSVQKEIRACDSDIGAYLDGNLSHLSGFVTRDSDLQMKIKQEIINSADGMFLLAQLYLHSLRGKRSPKAVQNALRQLVKGSAAYDTVYKEAIDRVYSQVSDLKELGLQVLSWITCAKRPLTTAELQHALGVEADQPYLDKDNLSDIQDIVSSCCGLVTIDEQSNIIRLVHYTTKEYFDRSESTWFPEAQSEITKACVTYISFDAFQNTTWVDDAKYAERLSLYPLYDYASRYWAEHAKRVPIYDSSLQLIKSLLCNNQVLLQSSRSLQGDTFRGRAPKGITVVHGAAHFGLENLMTQLKTANIDIDTPDENGETPLLWAARSRHVGMVGLLVDQGADINAFDFERKTTLHHAVENKWLTALKKLLRKGAMLVQDIDNMTPLHYAVLSGWSDGITVLLDAGVPIDLQVRRVQFVQEYDDDRRVFRPWDRQHQPVSHLYDASAPGLTSLHLAALVGNFEMVRYLLRLGANPARKSDHGEIPLHLCVSARISDEHLEDIWAEGSRRIEGLFDIIDVSNAEEYVGIQHHILEQRLAIVSELLASPATQVDAQDLHGSSCLHIVDYSRKLVSQEIVSLLLEIGGAQIDLRDGHGRSPLHLACQKGDTGSVKVLLDHGACTRIQDNRGCNALHYAAKSSNDETLYAVLNHMEDVGTSAVAVRDAEGRTVLHHLLSWFPSMEALECLLTLGADVNTLDNSGKSPLAVFLGSQFLPPSAASFVQRLLDQGAEISGMGLHHILAESSELDLDVLRLLQQGA